MRTLLGFLICALNALAVDVVTSEYNNARTGHNPSETILTKANVSGGGFGRLGSYPVDGTIYGRPLFLDAYPFTAGTKDAVFLATMANKLYAYDRSAYGAAALIWSIQFGAATDISLIPGGPVHGSNSWVSNNVGCTATPQIDRTAGIIYALCTDGTAGSTTTGWVIHRVTISTGAEIGSGTPVANVLFSGAGDQFSSTHDTQDGSGNFYFQGHWQVARTMALANGYLYTVWGAYADQRPGHGEIIAYNTSTMAVAATWTCSPSPTSASDSGLCSIWQSGRGVPIDASGNLYPSTGNGGYDGSTAFGDAWLKLSSTLGLSDWYTPHNNSQINDGDWDISSSGAILVPGTSWLVGGAKDRLVRVINTANMGQSDPGDGSSPTRVTATNSCNTACAYQISGIYNQAYSPYNGMFYESDVDGPIYGMAFNSTTGVLSAPSVQTPVSFGFPGGFTSISYNGSSPSGTDILWVASAYGQPANPSAVAKAHSAFQTIVPGKLSAFDATTLALLYDSDAAPFARDSLGSLAKFQPPMVDGGKVYLPNVAGALVVYGLGTFTSPQPNLIGYR